MPTLAITDFNSPIFSINDDIPIPASASPLRKFELIVSLEMLLHIADNSPNLPDYEGRVPMIALGFGEAQIAISNIMANLFPEKKITLHSTSI